MDIITFLEAFLLGLVQGLTEFLPVSSSAHLKIIPWLFGFETPGLVFDTSLHLGSSLALLIFFFEDFWKMTRSLLAPGSFNNANELRQYQRLTLGIILGIFPIGITGLLLEDHIEWFFGNEMLSTSIYLVGAMLILFGAFLWFFDKRGTQNKDTLTMTFKDAIIIGFIQICALIPGVSRSGATIVAGLSRGLTRAEAAKFSFLLGTPVVILAGLFKLKDLADITMTSELFWFFSVGVMSSALSSYLVIKFFLAFLKKQKLTLFVIYRYLLGLFIIGVATARLLM